jgi:sterol desaturase/sphingolipid hydroxylase (fatty acid hydroxylase superfamily)
VRALARRWLWPLFVGGSALAYGLAFTRGAATEAVLLVPAVQVLILFALEPWLPAERDGSALRDPRLGNDLAHNLVGFGLGTPLSDALVLAATALLAGQLSSLAGGTLWPAHWPFAVQAALVILLADGLETLRHRLFHASPRLWPFHAVHHEGAHLHIGKSGRNHFLDLGARGLFVFAPLALLGAPREALLAYPAAVSVFGPIAHANLDLATPRWLHRWLMTPAVHHVHHARSLALALHNYANVLPLWDRIFRSFLDPSDLARPDAGLEHDPNPPGFWAQLLAPLGLR